MQGRACQSSQLPASASVHEVDRMESQAPVHLADVPAITSLAVAEPLGLVSHAVADWCRL